MVQINWTKQAIDDLLNIFEYISCDSTKYAKLQVLRIKERTKILKQQPFAGHIVSEIKREDLRQIIEGRYRIIYRIVTQERIDIITIHHSSRDFTKRISEIV
jgi:addiction module RelE/StbE family toxin